MIKNYVYDYFQNQSVFIEKCKELLNLRFKKNVFSFFVHSYGCQGNFSDGEKIEGILEELGFKRAYDEKTADLIVLNSCAIREKAQNKVFSHLGSVLNLKFFDRKKIVCVCGCMVQQKDVQNKLKTNFKALDLVFGPHVIYKIPELLFKMLSKTQQYVDVSEKEKVVEKIPVSRKSKIKALVPISYGCNNFCSYCIVPYVKGKERSRKFEDVLKEVENLVEKGYREITLLGQNVNSYGYDLGMKNGFANLLLKINEIKGEFIVRFMTSHPKDFTKELVDIIAKCRKVCKHFHLPVQSGCDEILKQMNRKYDAKKYLDIIEYVKEKIPNATLSTDIIVGFPQETYENFKETLNLVKKVKYTTVFNFIYSKRLGTKAAKMKDPVTKKEKTKWLKELIETQNEISYNLNKEYVDKIQTVLFTDLAKNDENLMVGRNDGNVLVVCKKDDSRIGKFSCVKITNAHRTMLEGTII